jgi:putative membrane protein
MEAFLPYTVAKALHLLAVIAWMAGLLMLPRLMAYQTESTPGGELDLKMIEAQRRLRAVILTPTLVLTWVLGLYILLVANPGLMAQPWIHIKLLLVTILSGLHGFYVAGSKRLAKGERRRSGKFWRLMNEVPFLIAIPVVLLAILKPSFG